MRFVLQRVKHASVKVDGELIGSIGRGYMVLMGVSDTDTEEITDKMVDKMCKLRNPELANHLYEHALARCAGQVRKVEHGIFGADMKVELLNDGPFTILLDSDTIVKKK